MMTVTNAKDVPNTTIEISVNIQHSDDNLISVKDVSTVQDTISEGKNVFKDNELAEYEETPHFEEYQPWYDSNSPEEKAFSNGYYGGLAAVMMTHIPANSETIATAANVDTALPCSFEAPAMAGSEACNLNFSHNRTSTLSDPIGFNSLHSDLDLTSALSMDNPSPLSYQESDFSSNFGNGENHNDDT
jgi:hypothetical protein